MPAGLLDERGGLAGISPDQNGLGAGGVPAVALAKFIHDSASECGHELRGHDLLKLVRGGGRKGTPRREDPEQPISDCMHK